MTLPDSALEAIVLTPAEPSKLAPLTVHGPPETWVVTTVLDLLQNWGKARYFATCAANGHGGDFDGIGWRYATDDDLDPEEEPFTGVRVNLPPDEVAQVDTAPFEQLLVRYFQALIACAEQQGHPALWQDWWPDFIKDVRAFTDRVASPGNRSET